MSALSGFVSDKKCNGLWGVQPWQRYAECFLGLKRFSSRRFLALRKIFAVIGHCSDLEKCLTSIVRSLLQHTLICCQINQSQLIKESHPAAFLPDMPIRWTRLAAALFPPSFQTSLTTVSSFIVSGSMLTSYPRYSQGSSAHPEMDIWVFAFGSSSEVEETLISAMPNRILLY